MGILSLLGGLASSIIGANATRRAGNAAAAATREATAAANQGFDFLRNNPLLQQAQDQGQTASGLASGLLGLGENPAASQQAFDTFRGSTGYNFRLDQGLGAIENRAATAGLLNSGATLKGLNDFAQNTASAEFNNYLNALLGVQTTGINAAGTIGGAAGAAGAAAGQFISNNNGGAQFIRDRAGVITGGIGDAAAGLQSIIAAQVQQQANQPLATNPFGLY